MEIRCCRCKRILKDEESKKRGMGETCALRLGIVIKAAKRAISPRPVLKRPLLQRFLFSLDDIEGRESRE